MGCVPPSKQRTSLKKNKSDRVSMSGSGQIDNVNSQLQIVIPKAKYESSTQNPMIVRNASYQQRQNKQKTIYLKRQIDNVNSESQILIPKTKYESSTQNPMIVRNASYQQRQNKQRTIYLKQTQEIDEQNCEIIQISFTHFYDIKPKLIENQNLKHTQQLV